MEENVNGSIKGVEVDMFDGCTPETLTKEPLENKSLSLSIRKDKLVPLISKIVEEYANAVEQTYGPGGYDTIIEQPNGVFTTKDGWTVAKHLTLRLNADLVALSRMVLDAASNTNLKVGDGTTTAILITHYLNRLVQKAIENNPMPMYKIKKLLVEAVDNVCDVVMEHAMQIAKPVERNGKIPNIMDDDLLVIWNIAKVATNWNAAYAKIIANIYKETGNPNIRVERSGGNTVTYEIINGYNMKGLIHLPEFYMNDMAHQCTRIKRPIVLMFDFDVHAMQYSLPLVFIAKVLAQRNAELVVMAPGFDNDFVKALNRHNMEEYRNGRPPINLRLVKVHQGQQIDKSLYHDFSIVMGAVLIGNDNQDDFNGMCQDIRRAHGEVVKVYNSTDEDKDAKTEAAQNELQELIEAGANFAIQFAGSCEELVVTDKEVVATIDKSMWTDHQNKRVQDLIDLVSGQLDKAISKSESLSAILNDVADCRTRLSKLSCCSGVIKVGGYGDGDIAAIMASLDDAISACRSAWNSGYVIGGGYVVPHVIANNFTVEQRENNPFYDCIAEAFTECIATAYKNYTGVDSADSKDGDKIADGIVEGKPYDFVAGKFDTSFYEPAMTSIEVLRGSMRLVKLIATSNQYLYKKYTVSELIGADDIGKALEF